MLIRKTLKYRLYPNKTQEAQLIEWLDRNRELYNAALEERREAYRRAHKTITYIDQTKSLAAVRDARPEYYAIPISVLRGTLQRLDRAYQAFFRRVKAGQTPGFPRFQGRQRFDSFTYNQVHATHLIDGHRVNLPMFGAVKIVLHRPLQGTVKQITVRRDADQWYVCFSCEVVSESNTTAAPVTAPIIGTEIQGVAVTTTPDGAGDAVMAPTAAVGIDLGLEKFAVLSTGEQIANPRYLRTAEAKLKARQEHLSRCVKGSHRRDRARRAVARWHRKVRNQRSDFLHKLARRLVTEYGTIVMEDLRPANLSRRPKARPNADGTGYDPNGAAAKAGLNKSISDAGWAMFQQYITVKAEWAGRHVILVNPAYTSQTCSGCGQIRKRTCPSGGTPVNVARNWIAITTPRSTSYMRVFGNTRRAGERPTPTRKGKRCSPDGPST